MKKSAIFCIAALLLSATLFTASCRKEKNNTPEYYYANEFIYQYTKAYYLWTDSVTYPDWSTYTDPAKLFEDIIYKPSDRWSFVTPDYLTVLNEFQGTSKTNGLKFRLFLLNPASNTVIAQVEHVYKGSPAESAGIKRGNIISRINGASITKENYSSLLSNDNYQVTLCTINNGTITDAPTPINLTAVVMNLNPVLLDTVLNYNGKKIGYLVYDQFIDEYFTDLDVAFANFKSAQINDLVLDLRFNPGGSVNNCQKLASLIVPAANNQDIFTKFEWNNLMTDFIVNNYGADSENLQLKFLQMSNNMNLPRVVVLTSDHSASASEMTINSLKPYMEVKLVGDTTHGKYTAAGFFYDNEYYMHNWGLYLVINKFKNSLGVTDFRNGFAPDFVVTDDYTTPLGNTNEPLLAAALNYLAPGVPAKKSIVPEYVNYKVGSFPEKKNLPSFVMKNTKFGF